jgi:UDP-N-acetyl-D-glucosamine dehydrogenase
MLMEINRIIVVGLGYVGLPLAINAAKSGYLVTGFDIDKDKIYNLQNGVSELPEVEKSELMHLQVSGNLKFLDFLPKQLQPAIFVIAVPTPLDTERNPDLTMLNRACELISSVIFDGSLVINESTSFIGTLNNLIKPTITSLAGLTNLDFAVAPERIDPSNKKWNLKSTPRLLAGVNERSTKRALDFYSRFSDHVHPVSSPEVAEAAKLFENTFRQVNIALVNELSQITNSLKIPIHEVIKAASTKPYGFMPFYPSIGVGGHCIPIDPSYLAYSAQSVGISSNFIDLANHVNLSMPYSVGQRIKAWLDGDLNGKKIQIAGISYKPNVADTRESPVLELMKELSKLGAIISWHDPLVKVWGGHRSLALDDKLDLGIIASPHDSIDFTIWQESGIDVLDLSANTKNYGWPKFL